MYDDYLASVDPLGQVKGMVALHENALRWKRVAGSQMQRVWDGVLELRELAEVQDGEGR